MNRRLLLIAGTNGGVLFLAAIVTLTAAPWFLKDDMIALVDAELDRAVGGDATIGRIQVGLFATFPRLNVTLSDVVVTGSGPFAEVELLRLPSARVGLDTWSVLSGDTVEIRSLEFTSPTLDIRVLPDGRSNVEALMGEKAEDSEASGYAVQLDGLAITDATIRYDDRHAGQRVAINGLDVEASGSISSERNHLITRTGIAALTVEQGGTTWLRDTRWTADVEFDQDLASGALAIDDARIAVNALELDLAGTLTPESDGWDMDLDLSTEQAGFKPLLSLVPGAYTSGFDGVDADGSLALSGQVKGRYSDTSWPGMDLTLHVEEGRFRYPDLPVGIDGIRLDVAVKHPGGDPDGLAIDIDPMAMSLGGTPIEGRISVRHPMSDPDVSLAAVGRLDLDQLARALPAVADADPPSGQLDLDLSAAGRVSAFQAQQVDNVKAEGRVRARGLRYTPEDGPPVRIERLDLQLSAARATLDALDLSWTGSELSATGTFDNILPYAVAGETLVGTLELRSAKTVDLRPFQGDEDADDTPDTADEAVVVPVPANVDLTVDARFARVRTTDLDMRKVSGKMVVHDQAVDLKDWKAEMLGGEVELSGRYFAPTAAHADVDMSVDAIRFDVREAVERFETLLRIAPVLERATGRFDSDLAMNVRILRDGTPELSLLSSSGTIGAGGISLKADTLDSVAQQLKYDELSTLSPGQFAYDIAKGKLDLKPFDAKLGPVPARISGRAGLLDETLDLAMDLAVPTKGLGKAPFLSGLDVVPSTADVRVRLTGTYAKPKIGVALQGADDLIDQVKTAVVDEVKKVANEAIDDLVAAARAQGDALVAAAEKQAQTLRDEASKAAKKVRKEGDKAGDKLIDAAKGNPVKTAAAKEGAKALEKEADKSADKIEREADKAADKVVDEAKSQRERLIDEAERKMRNAAK